MQHLNQYELSISNHRIYNGEGFMKSDQTEDAKNAFYCVKKAIDIIKDESENVGSRGYQSFSAIQHADFIYKGFLLYARDFTSSMQSDANSRAIALYKYGARRLKLEIPHHSDNNIEKITISVIMPSLLFAKRNYGSLYIAFENSDVRWPYHNVFARTSRARLSSIMSNRDLFSQINEYSLSKRKMSEVCVGYAVDGIDFFTTPELYVHTLLTSESNDDLHHGATFDKDAFDVIEKYDVQDKVIDLSKVSNLLKGYMPMANLINTIKERTQEGSHVQSVFLSFMRQYMNGEKLDEMHEGAIYDESHRRRVRTGVISRIFDSASPRQASLNLLLMGIVSAFNNVEMVEEVLKSFKEID